MVPPNHPILIGVSIINHPFWGPTPIFGNTHMIHLGLIMGFDFQDFVTVNWKNMVILKLRDVFSQFLICADFEKIGCLNYQLPRKSKPAKLCPLLGSGILYMDHPKDHSLFGLGLPGTIVKLSWNDNLQGTRTGVPLTYVYPWYLLCSLGILENYNP